MSYSLFASYGPDSRIAAVLDDLVMTYLPEGGTLYDPTCGEKQHQLRVIKKGKLDISYNLIMSDLKPVGHFVGAISHIPLQDNAVDLTIYDPPFTPKATHQWQNARPNSDYGIDADITVDDIKRFYSSDIIMELLRVSRKYIFIRGQDFYFPRTSYSVYYFWQLCCQTILDMGLELRALHINRVTHGRLPIYRARMRKYERPIINHSYIAVVTKQNNTA